MNALEAARVRQQAAVAALDHPPVPAPMPHPATQAVDAVPARHAAWLAQLHFDAMNTGTVRSYCSALKGVALHGDMPDTDAVLARIRQLDDEGKSLSAIRTCVAAAKWWNKETGNPLLNDVVDGAVKDIGRRRGKEDPKQSAPIRNAHLGRLDVAASMRRKRGPGVERAATAANRATVDRTIIRLLRAGLMRVSELAGARLSNLERNGDGTATLTFERKKGGLPGTCLIGKALLVDIDAIDRKAEYADSIIPLSVGSIARRVKRLCEDAGLEGSPSSHGGRVGAVRDLVGVAGESLIRVQLAGGWRSPDMPALYSRREAASESAMASNFLDE